MHTSLDSRPAIPEGALSIPASFAQHRMWFLEQLLPVNGVYNVFKVYRLRGHLNVAALEHSVNAVIERHEGLRTRFIEREGIPWQVILPSLVVPLPVVDLRGTAPSAQKEEMCQIREAEALGPFDLGAGPLLRTKLLRLADEEHVLLLTIHHIISDQWSMRVMVQELATLYAGFTGTDSSTPHDLPIQYADYAVWQREWLQGELLGRQQRYWKGQLAGIVPLSLPVTPRQAGGSDYRGASEHLVLSPSLVAGLKSLGQRAGVTLFMTVLAAFYVLLSRYSGQDDLAVGTPIAGRSHPDTEGLIGFFVNTLVLRTDLSGDPPFIELLGRVREVCLSAYDHQDLPFEKLVEELSPERDLDRNPFFDVMINFTTDLHEQSRLGDVTIAVLGDEDYLSKFAMELYVDAGEHGIELKLVCQETLFNKEEMKCFLEQYRYLLEQTVAAPDVIISAYTLVTPHTSKLLPDPNLVLKEPRFLSVISLFTACTQQAEDRTAVRQGMQSWSYKELGNAVQQLALQLIQRGIGKGGVVALTGPRSFATIVGMFGILFSGGVLLPIEPILPAARKRLVLQEAGATMVLQVVEEKAPDSSDDFESGFPVLFVNAVDGSIQGSGIDDGNVATALAEPAPDDPAYIFFTSGSTGIPKGVLGCHKSLNHFLDWQRRTFDVGPEDRVAQLTGLSFDVVLRDIFLPLTSGGTVCLPREQDELDIPNWLEREQITVVHTVPAVLQSWLDHARQGVALRALRWLFVAGEPLNGALVTEWRRAFPECGEIVNFYGTTETTMVKCYHRIGAGIVAGIQPAGTSIPDSQALVLSDQHHLCGVGEVGEIALRTPFRTLGYINAPEENRKRFIINPYREDSGDLVYLTGDRGRYKANGSLEILGRLDNQIKIRGVRVEPAEVSAILVEHPSVNACVVAGRGDSIGEKYLAAYVVLHRESATSAAELQAWLRNYLPGAMVPGAVIFLDRLPRLPNGKIDVQALTKPDVPVTGSQDTCIGPRTPIEGAVAEIWSEMLGVSPIGIHDNFFDLGGHSLLATRVAVRLADKFGIALPLRRFFEIPTIAELTVYVTEYLAKEAVE